MPIPFQNVAYARPAPVGDRQLGQLILIARDAKSGNADEARGEWLLSCAAELLEELRDRRAAMGDAPFAENVVLLGHRA